MEKKAFLTTLPDFLEIQRASFCWFLKKGLSEELDKFSSITHMHKIVEIKFFNQEYRIKKPKYDLFESKKRNLTYSIKLYVPISIKIYNNPESPRYYHLIGELPLMSERATFVINGYERVIVNQIIRSPGIYYKEEVTKSRFPRYSATIIPNRGSWLNFLITKDQKLAFSIDKSDKINIDQFFNILGVNSKKIPRRFQKYKNESLKDFTEIEKLEIQKDFATRIFNSKYYEFGKVARYKLNNRFNLNNSNFINDLTVLDIVTIIDELLDLYEWHIGKIDDIDHLENRRVRSVGELLQTQLCSGLSKLERIAFERVKICNPYVLKLKTIFNEKPVNSVMREFFGSSQLSQFLDQTNPIAELTHRRRISGLGPGGFSRDHVSLLVRDIHPSHYGRICPIETPEGQNAGLISSLAIYARINSFGFIETPFFKVKNGIVLKQSIPVYLTAEEEEKLKIASADIKIDKNGKILQEFVTVRYMNEFIKILSKEVQLITVSPIQIISSATALIPFLEHDDANRALMGSNMQRQAVPLLHPTKAIIGTGLETQLAADAGMVVISYTDGYVNEVTSKYIIITDNNNKKLYYSLQKYMRSNQDTCINQRPIVWSGEYVKSGQIIADGPGTENGEIALGQNITIAYVPWEGYNYEDALLVSERLIYADLFTSLHIEKYDIEVKETKGGMEKLTKNLPYISSKDKKKLDSNGIIIKGNFVRAGDILVGKITPNEEVELTPEERLLRAIFGEKKINVTDTSLRVPTGSYGRVLDIRIFSRENGDDLPFSTDSIVRVFLAQIRKIQIGDKMAGRHGNKGIISKILPREDMPYLPNGKPIDLILNPLGVPSRMNVGQLFEGLFGFAGDILDKRFKIVPFDEMFEVEASRILINNSLIKARKQKENRWVYNNLFPGKILLRDGRTGEYFENPITICKSYILKLVHLVDDKIHARSTGPYSLITQQPLGGKSQQGGQRFGEMEVWALQAFGAAYTLQEILTIKSDDIEGRNNTLNAIIKGEPIPEPGIPESFKVLILELQSLCLDIGIYKIKKDLDGEINAVELDIMKNSNSKILLPNYKSFEII
jgi:DNA-directed RNA polymerase subunit beta